MSQNFISNALMQFQYFDLQLDHPDWKGKKVLDFGGNVGNILTDHNCGIEQKNYYCIDVSQKAILEGQKRYPKAKFIFYDDYNLSFNPTGIPDLEIPDIGVRFDYILAYSIFTHMNVDEVHNKIDQLIQLLDADGTLIFTFLDADYNGADHFNGYQDITNLEKRIRRLNDGSLDQKLIEYSKDAHSMILVNGKYLYNNGTPYKHKPRADGDTIFTFFSPEYLTSKYECKLKNPPSEPYHQEYPAEMQHACIIKRNEKC